MTKAEDQGPGWWDQLGNISGVRYSNQSTNKNRRPFLFRIDQGYKTIGECKYKGNFQKSEEDLKAEDQG